MDDWHRACKMSSSAVTAGSGEVSRGNSGQVDEAESANYGNVTMRAASPICAVVVAAGLVSRLRRWQCRAFSSRTVRRRSSIGAAPAASGFSWPRSKYAVTTSVAQYAHHAHIVRASRPPLARRGLGGASSHGCTCRSCGHTGFSPSDKVSPRRRQNAGVRTAL